MADRSASIPEMKAVRAPHGHYDVAIMGGGLAGLSMALQLKRQRPDTKVLVCDKRAEPAPEAAFKVGESTVENGAYYYREILGMKDHLESVQLRKLGLRFYMPAGDNSDLSRRVEFCTPATPGDHPVWTHQIDRGRFENELFNRCVAAGADAYRGWRVTDVEIGPGTEDHKVTFAHEDDTVTVTAHWVVDATGRRNVLRNKLGLGTETGHHINAAWFRLGGGLDFEEWIKDEEWLNREKNLGIRSYATTHLVDEGYWLWLIRLASGPISIGLCADPRFHPFDQINTFDGLLSWMEAHEPQLAAEVKGRREQVEDFLVIEDFSYASSEMFSMDRWTLTGEAGGFIDALYSPGSDYIAYGNSFGGDLICRELDGEDIEERLDFFNFFFFQLFNPTISLYKDQYQFFGNPQVMLAKQLYDNTAYFCTLAFLFVHGKMTQPEDLGDIVDMFETLIPLLERMQGLFREWHPLEPRKWEGVSVLSNDFEPIVKTQYEIGQPFDQGEMIERAREKVEVVKAMATWIFFLAAKNLPEPPDPEARINPLAVSLDPGKWEAEGLFTEDGMTLAEALELLPGVEEFDLAARGAAVAG
ncbi:MAG: NAD(P)/FAD-dependent oxidoreductase [Solirubrobacteraceae bacterium]